VALIVVSGPPCSGKSTYIRQRATADDVVIDLDRIALAFAIEGTGDHDYPDHIRAVARKARLAAIDLAIRYAQATNVWIIEAAPTSQARAWYAARGARFVKCTATPTELAERISRRPERNQRLIASL
jgi:hypothetical protein